MAAPSTAQISVSVAGKLVHVNPPDFVSLSMERLAGDSCNSFTLRILDTSAFDVEYALLNNTGGNLSFTYKDEANETFKTFTGYVLKINDSFVDDRVMLSVEGFVGVSFSDKFDKLSFAWNVVPKFDWWDVFSGYTNIEAGYGEDQNEEDGFFENIGNWFMNMFGQGWQGLAIIGKYISSGGNLDSILERQLYGNGEEMIEQVLDNLKVDEAGNYYLPNRQMSNDYEATDTEKSHNVKQSGNIVIPMKPSKLVKFIGRGGQFSELLEDDFDNYRGTNFYNGTNKVSKMDWMFIKSWYKRMGRFPGCGWKVIDANIQDTDMKQADFTQTKQSYLQYINKVLIPNSSITSRDSEVYTKDGKKYYREKEIVRTNFMLSFDSDGTVYYKRVKITNSPESVAASYTLYGKEDGDLQRRKHGHLVAFSPTLDVLTSMITQGIESGGDISNLNLVTGEPNQDYQKEADPENEDDLTAFKDWGSLKVTKASGSTEYAGTYDLSTIQAKAMAQCYQAKATIEGPCTVSPQDYIHISIIPRNPDLGGVQVHHTSGTYYVLKIHETLEGGRHYSELSLIKNVGSMGATGTTTTVVSDTELKGYMSIDIQTDPYKGEL